MDELKEIKKIYGEDMMRLCRELFPSLLEKRGLLLSILKDKIAPTHSLGKDIIKKNKQESFKDYIYSFVTNKKILRTVTDKTPFELMDEAGYKLYECKSEEDIQSFRKYYVPNEMLCTIYMGGRLERCYVFFAVKKNVDEIKREDFKSPQRQDKYGTSVISIQFSKGKNNTVSIKNRYNHTVDNPDSTFGNNLEKIIPGLTDSFEKYFNLNIKKNIDEYVSDVIEDMGPYIQASDGKWYRYNVETNWIYYCENNIIIDTGRVIRDYADHPERYILADYYIFDMKEKKVYPYNDKEDDAFVKSINDVGEIERIYVTKNDDGKTINVVYKDKKEIKIKINGNNGITRYYNDYVESIGDDFLDYNKTFEEVSLSNVKSIGSWFLYENQILESISLPKVEIIDDCFLKCNYYLKEIYLPNVRVIGDHFCLNNLDLKEISLPNVKKIGEAFLKESSVEKVSLPNVKEIGDEFLCNNYTIEEISLPKVQKIGDSFLRNNLQLSNILIPKVIKIGEEFLVHNTSLEELSLPKVQEIGGGFLGNNYVLKSFSAPNLKRYYYYSTPGIQDINDYNKYL